jgi:hypothetical protein
MGEPVGWGGSKGRGYEADGAKGRLWGVARPYRVGLFRIAGRVACWTYAKGFKGGLFR